MEIIRKGSDMVLKPRGCCFPAGTLSFRVA